MDLDLSQCFAVAGDPGLYERVAVEGGTRPLSMCFSHWISTYIAVAEGFGSVPMWCCCWVCCCCRWTWTCPSACGCWVWWGFSSRSPGLAHPTISGNNKMWYCNVAFPIGYYGKLFLKLFASIIYELRPSEYWMFSYFLSWCEIILKKDPVR